MHLWFGTDGKVTVQLTARDWPHAQRVLDQYLDGKETLGQQPAYEEVRKHLPEAASGLTLIDVPKFARAVAGIIVPLIAERRGGKGDQLPDLDKVKLKTSYTGLALTLQPRRGSVDVWLPASSVQELRKLAEPLRKAKVGAGEDK
jgi:hypothetical protein